MPHVLVKQSTGSECPSFEEAAKRNESKDATKVDFNDPKYW
jgi:hypothetical protein